MYAYSNSSKGPWIGEHDKPDMALGSGRAMYGNVIIYVAEVRPIKPSDGMPNIRAMIGEIRETLVEKYGPGADEFFDGEDVIGSLPRIERYIESTLDEIIIAAVDISFMIPQAIKAYGRDRHVKTGDFAKEIKK